MRASLLFICVILVTVLSPAAEAVCGVPQPRLVSAEYFASGLVVEATLEKTDEIHDRTDPDYALAYIYTLKVNRVLRGKASATVRVRDENDSSRTTFDWAPGQAYLLFLFHVSNEQDWVADGCGNSGPLSDSKDTLSEVLRARAMCGDGTIYGFVSWPDLSSPIAGVHITVSGSAGPFEALTGRNGRFRFKVPPGHYVLRASKEGAAFETAFLSYSDPNDLSIQPGGSVQVQFASIEPSQ